MIAAFPDAYPGEAFYSLIARCSQRLRYGNARALLGDVFGCRNIVASLPFASHLDSLAAALPPGAGYGVVEQLVERHTLLPFYRPFLPAERVARLVADMRGAGGPALHARAGIMASGIPCPRAPRFCPRCAQADRDRFGECYWHTVHQVPGVLVCPEHEMWLDSAAEYGSAADAAPAGRHEFVVADDAVGVSPVGRPVAGAPGRDLLLRIASSAAWLLQHPTPCVGLEELREGYRRRLADRGLATVAGRLLMRRLVDAFVASFPAAVLRLLKCDLSRDGGDSWLARLLRRPRCAQHPVRHLLLLAFLGCEPAQFFARPRGEKESLGGGQWPCPNPTCPHFRQPHIPREAVTVTYAHGRPVATLQCDCGYAFTCGLPEDLGDDWPIGCRVLRYGLIWEGALRRAWDDTSLSLNATARQLGVDPLTAKRHAARLGLAAAAARPRGPGIPGPPPRRSVGSDERGRAPASSPGMATARHHRRAWLAAVDAHPGWGVAAIRAAEPQHFTWLYRHDRAWLNAHRPRAGRPAPRPRVDWLARDHALAEQVRTQAVVLKQAEGKPVRVTATAIGRRIGHLALLEQHLDRLPETRRELTNAVESRVDYALRRIGWAVTVLSQAPECPKMWEIERRAGVGRLSTLAVIREALRAAEYELTDKMASR